MSICSCLLEQPSLGRLSACPGSEIIRCLLVEFSSTLFSTPAQALHKAQRLKNPKVRLSQSGTPGFPGPISGHSTCLAPSTQRHTQKCARSLRKLRACARVRACFGSRTLKADRIPWSSPGHSTVIMPMMPTSQPRGGSGPDCSTIPVWYARVTPVIRVLFKVTGYPLGQQTCFRTRGFDYPRGPSWNVEVLSGNNNMKNPSTGTRNMPGRWLRVEHLNRWNHSVTCRRVQKFRP